MPTYDIQLEKLETHMAEICLPPTDYDEDEVAGAGISVHYL